MDGRQLRPVVELHHDPHQLLESALDVLQHGRPQATSWMQKLRRAKPLHHHSVSGAVLYDGRLCCADVLRAYEGRTDLAYPFLVTCPDCERIYRVRLDVVRRS